MGRIDQPSFRIKKSYSRIIFNGLIIFLGAFLVTAISAHFNKPVLDSNASIDPSGYHLDITSSSNLNLKLEGTPDGAMASTKDTIRVKTNIPSGFKLFLSSNNNQESSRRLNKNGSPSASSFLSPTSGTINAPAPLDTNSWGFAIKQESTNSFSSSFDPNYQTPLPTKTSKWAGLPLRSQPATILKTTTPNPDPGITQDVYYAVKANTSLEAGAYTSTILYSAIGNISNTIGSSTDSGYIAEITPAETYNLAGGEQIQIATSLYTKEDVGEVTVLIDNQPCTNITKNIANHNLKLTCNTPTGTIGKKTLTITIPKYNITINQAEAFEYKSQTTFNSITTMQQMTPEICEAETTPHAFLNGQDSNPIVANTTRQHSVDKNLVPEAYLLDTRDNKIYIVRKLADGRCWMVQNLDLDLNTNTTLTNQNTDLNSKASWTPNNSTQDNTGISWGDAQNTSNQARSYNPGDKYLTGTGSSSQTVSDSGPKTAHSGNLYNWYAATAGSGTYNMATLGQEAQDSICPKGWKLPYGNNRNSYNADSGDFRKLTNTYGITTGSSNGNSDTKLLSAPLNFIRSGYYYYSDEQPYAQGSIGFFWSSSVYRQSEAHGLSFSSSSVRPQSVSDKGNGPTVRCVARENKGTFSGITKMQEMTTQICNSETTPHAFQNGATSGTVVSVITRQHSTDRNLVPEAELTDIRDNKKYIVRKLADGRCWMVQNLDLDLNTSTTLTNQNTDLNSKTSWTPENSTQNNTGVVWGSNNNNQQASSSARSYNPGDKYLTGTGSSNQTISDSGPKTAHTGNRYNWYAATAGSGTYSMATPGQEAQDSICPKGWKLPYGNNSQGYTADSGDFRKLTNIYGITTGADNGNNDIRLLSAPLNFVRSGYYNYSIGQFYYQGSYGFFWSSSVYSQASAHALNFYSSYVNPQSNHPKGYGFAARCLVR